MGGRAAVIVPDGVLFGSSNAHQQIRKQLIDSHRLQGVISMPSGVFRPYAGVSTAVLLFTKTDSGGTNRVWFYDMSDDGYSLDDKRNRIDADDIPDILLRWKNLDGEANRSRTEKSFLVPVEEIHANKYDLSINRYKEAVYEQKLYSQPHIIIGQIEQLDIERTLLLQKLKLLLANDVSCSEIEEKALNLAAEPEIFNSSSKRVKE